MTRRKQNGKGGSDRGPPTGTKAPAAAAPGLIVGLGASAGGLEAFKAFFTHVPPRSGLAYVLIQHLDPKHKSLLVELLGKHTEMPVVQAEDGMAVAADSVFVIPPDAVLTIAADILHVVRPAPPREHRRPIDTFFAALAEDQGEKAVCIILSGTGSDGTHGVKAAKEHGGLTMAQAGSDETALLGMPSSAAATGLVDHVMPVEAMPAMLIDYERHLGEVRNKKGPDGIRRDSAQQLVQICTLLRTRLGHDFSQYKEKTLIRRIQRRMQVLQIDGVADYIERLRKEPAQLDLLFRDLLIGVTQFFRDPDAFAALASQVIPKLLENKRGDDHLRIWVPGCATGEEAYSIAILMQEAMIELEVAPKLQIFATDLDDHAIAIARQGRYRKPLPGVSPERLERWFGEEGEDYYVAKGIREMCIYSVHNLIKDPAFSRLDLISCRNLMIYLDAPLQNRLMRTFHYALRPSGFLFLGASEGVARHGGLFTALDKRHRLFQRQDDVRASLPNGEVGPAPTHPISSPEQPASVIGDAVDQRARHALEKYSPAYVVINQHRDVVRFSGRTGHYIEHSAGTANFNLFSVLRKDLLPAVRDAVQEALATHRPVAREDVVIAVNGHSKVVSVIVERISEADGGLYVVAFQDRGFVGRQGSAADATEAADVRVRALEKELRATRTQLQTTIDDLETANEELKSTNEEYQSVNEEFQSTNEELESSKEELQSMNEELHTINGELNAKNEALAEANSDIRNLLDSTQIATLFLDNDLRIKSFTPIISEIFHVRAGDRGRPITEIVTRLSYADLKRDVKKVLRDLSVIEREVAGSEDGATFIMRIRPYRTVNDAIDGVVLTFVDVTERKRHEAERARLAAIVASSQDAIVGHSLDGKITSWNQGAEQIFGYAAKDAIGKPLAILIPEQQVDEVPRILERLARGEHVEHFDAGRVTRRGDRIDVSMTISPVRNEVGTMIGASTIGRDVSERNRLLESRHSEQRIHQVLATLPVAIYTTDAAGRINYFNEAAVELTGRRPELGKNEWCVASRLYWPDGRPMPHDECPMAVALKEGRPIRGAEMVAERSDGTRIPFLAYPTPLRDEGGMLIGAVNALVDISERKNSEDLRGLMVNELNHRVKNTLATVQSIAARSLRETADAESREAFDSRLVALAGAHDLLSRESWEGASLRDLLLQELGPYQSEDGARAIIEGPDLGLWPKAALVLVMAFHELATNAAKHGAFSTPAGRVRVAWDVQRSSEPRLRLKWSETGGPPMTTRGRNGFGTTLIERGLSLELDGKVRLDFGPGGLVCTIEIPLRGRGGAIDVR